MERRLPHSIAVLVEEMGLREGRSEDRPLLDIHANLYVERSSQKGIIIGHQGSGSITELTIQRLLTLQGTMKPHQIISLMKFDNTDNTFAMGDHADHIHVGFQSLYGSDSKTAKQVNAILKPKQWIKLIDRLGEIDNPTVRRSPSRFSLDAPTPGRASDAHTGE